MKRKYSKIKLQKNFKFYLPISEDGYFEVYTNHVIPIAYKVTSLLTNQEILKTLPNDRKWAKKGHLII